MKKNNLIACKPVLLIGIGNEYRSDDGIGLIIAREIRQKHLPSIDVREESGEGAALIEAWQGFQVVMIVDAVSSSTKPGTVFKIDAGKEKIPSKFFHSSTHAFSVAEAIELAKVTHAIPPKLVVYGIEGANFTAGITISPIVKAAAKKLCEQIIKDMQRIE